VHTVSTLSGFGRCCDSTEEKCGVAVLLYFLT
jgi:hypothetical protein